MLAKQTLCTLSGVYSLSYAKDATCVMSRYTNHHAFACTCASIYSPSTFHYKYSLYASAVYIHIYVYICAYLLYVCTHCICTCICIRGFVSATSAAARPQVRAAQVSYEMMREALQTLNLSPPFAASFRKGDRAWGF